MWRNECGANPTCNIFLVPKLSPLPAISLLLLRKRTIRLLSGGMPFMVLHLLTRLPSTKMGEAQTPLIGKQSQTLGPLKLLLYPLKSSQISPNNLTPRAGQIRTTYNPSFTKYLYTYILCLSAMHTVHFCWSIFYRYLFVLRVVSIIVLIVLAPNKSVIVSGPRVHHTFGRCFVLNTF